MLEDKLLVRRLKLGDGEALRQIYEKYKDALLSISASLLNDTRTAEDVLHDVFIALAESTGRFGLYGSLRNYLLASAINHVRDRLLEKMYEVVTVERAGPSGIEIEGRPEEVPSESEESQVLIEALAELPLPQQEAVLLHLLAEMSWRQIAKVQGVSVGTAVGRYRYGLERLRSLLVGKIEQ